MDILPYRGTWITCGSYALLHALQERKIDLIDLENSTGTPFGIACMEEDYECMRMLTVFRDFNEGIDQAAKLWGIEVQRLDADSKDELYAFLEDKTKKSFLLGPVSMACLTYLPLSIQYKCADHYIALLRLNENEFQLIDSEGVISLKITVNELMEKLFVNDIPEAKGKITIREVCRKGEAVSRSYLLAHTFETACRNLKEAEKNGQGSEAILRCMKTMKCIPEIKWKEGSLYDFDYFIQRKLMLGKLIERMREQIKIAVNPYLEQLLFRQITNSAKIRSGICHRNWRLLEDEFRWLAEDEYRLAIKLEEWISYDRN